MRRVLIVFAVLTAVLMAALGTKLVLQHRAAGAAPGGNGVVEGTKIDLRSRLSARVVTTHAGKGDFVRQGTPLVSLDCSEPRASLEEARARKSAAEAQALAAHAQASAARGSAQAARAQATAAKAQALALDAQRGAAERQAQRLEQLGNDASLAARDEVSSRAENLKHQVEATAQTQSASDHQARAAVGQEEAALAQADAALQSVSAAQAAVARAQVLVNECELVAPRDAYVEDVVLEPGELAMPGAVIVRLIDTSDVRATFYLANADLAAAAPDAMARVIADAYPGKTFTAHVLSVAHEAEFTPRNVQTRSDRDRLVYPVEVRIDDPEQLLRPGMPVEVELTGGTSETASR